MKEAKKDTITLEEFAENLKDDIDNFIKVWEEGVENKPEYFPESLSLNDWYEQYDSDISE